MSGNPMPMPMAYAYWKFGTIGTIHQLYIVVYKHLSNQSNAFCVFLVMLVINFNLTSNVLFVKFNVEIYWLIKINCNRNRLKY